MNNISIYTTVVISLIFFLYLIPGIALFPKFVLAPRTAATIPFVSISVVVVSQYVLSLFNQFNHQNVIILIGILTLVALYRIYNISKESIKKLSTWSKTDFIALFLIFFASTPLMILLGFDGFQHSDEIYSWNLWAKQLYFNQDITFGDGGAPYPLALPSFIAFCYKFVGNIDYQLPIKLTFSLIYVSTIFVIYSFATSKKNIGLFFIAFIIVMLVIGTGYEYKKVFADTLMGGFLVSSLALIISLSKGKLSTNNYISHNSIVLASIILICLAALTKQGAIPWTMVFFPLLAYHIIEKNNQMAKSIKWMLLAPMLTPVLWYFIGGTGFHNNVGVKSRSMGGRDYIDQLLYGFNEVFINKPSLLILMAIVFFVLFKKINFEKAILSIGIASSTVLMLLFGSYEPTRLYLHIVLIGWLVIFAYEDGIVNNKAIYNISKVGNNLYVYAIIILLFIWWDLSKLNQRIEIIRPVTNVLDGREVQANWMIGKTGAEQYRGIMDSKLGLLAPNSHIWGMYYGGMDNLFTDGKDVNINAKVRIFSDSPRKTINEIRNNNIGWIYYTRSRNMPRIKEVQNFCNESINLIDTSKNLHEQVLYKVDMKIINACIESLK
ncbi:hypothetical protein HOB87_10985 [Candidatus Woesearchaeota archaeon]|nr:hypothetical protein [Candidatus Woesearchaeota archaeon]